MVKEGGTNVKRGGSNIRVRTGRKPRGKNSAQKRRSEMRKMSEKKRSKRQQKIRYHLDRLSVGKRRRNKTHKKRVQQGGVGGKKLQVVQPEEVVGVSTPGKTHRTSGTSQHTSSR